MFRFDRDTIGDGVLLYVSEAFEAVVLEDLFSSSFGTAYGVK